MRQRGLQEQPPAKAGWCGRTALGAVHIFEFGKIHRDRRADQPPERRSIRAMIRMRMGDEDQADVSRAPAGALEPVANPLRPAPHAGINDNDALADQKEALDHIQRDVMNRNYRSAHIFSKVLSATLAGGGYTTCGREWQDRSRRRLSLQNVASRQRC